MRGLVFDGRDLVATDELEVRRPGPREVAVRVLASGICHSDLNVLDGTSSVRVPVVLGHEAAGLVAEVGPDVDGLGVGEAVAVASPVPCGRCRWCTRGRSTDCPDAFGKGSTPFTWRGVDARAYANVASFAETIVVRDVQVFPSAGLNATSAALIGCAVSTGYGVVRNVAKVASGDTVVVFGVGGIGVNVLQTARLQGAARVVAVDVVDRKAPVATCFGADTVVIPARGAEVGEVIAEIRDEVEEPIDVAIECSGAPTAIEAAIGVTAPGGTTALVGIPPASFRPSFDVSHLLRGRRVVGSLNGAVDPQRDFPAIIDLAREGRLELDAQVSRVWPLAHATEAFDAVRRGAVVRAVLDLQG